MLGINTGYVLQDKPEVQGSIYLKTAYRKFHRKKLFFGRKNTATT